MRFWFIASGVALVAAVLAGLLLRRHVVMKREQRKRERLKAIHRFLAGPAVTIRRPGDIENDDSDA